MNRLAKSALPALALAAVAVAASSFVDAEKVALGAGVAFGVLLVASVAEVVRRLDEVTAKVDSALSTSSSMPNAAEALAKASSGLAALETALPAAHRAAIDEVRTKLDASVSSIERSLAKSASALEANAEGARNALDATAKQVASSLETSSKTIASSLETSSKTIAGSLDTNSKQIAGSLDGTAKKVAGSLEAAAKDLPALAIAAIAAEANRALETTTNAATANLDAIRAAVESDVARRRDADIAAQSQLAEHLTTLERGLDRARTELAEAATTSDGARIELLSNAIATSSSRLVESLEGRLAAVTVELGTATASIRSQATAVDQRAAADAERVSALVERLGATAHDVGENAALQLGTIDKLAAAAEARLAATEAAAEARLGNVVDKLDALITTERERSAALDEAIRAGAAKTSEDVARLLGEHAKGLGDELAKTQALVHEAAGLVHTGGAELGSLAITFGEAVEKYRTASEEWLANLGAMEASIVAAGEHAASDVLGQQLARTHEIFDRQLRFQGELLDRLRANRNEPVREPDDAREPIDEAHVDAGE